MEVSTKERVNLLERLAGRLAQMLLARVPLRGGPGARAQAHAPDGGAPGHPRRRADPPALSGSDHMARVFLSVGSNLGDRLDCLRRAVEQLRAMPEVRFLDASPLYRTEPWERPARAERRRGRRLVLQLRGRRSRPTLPPAALLERLQAVERRPGPRRARAGTPEAQRYEPRPLDIDILLYDDRVISGPEHLHIPHLLMHERAFVLRPLADLAPDLEHPVLYQTIRELLDAPGGRARGAAVGPAAPVVRVAGPRACRHVADDEFRQQALQHLDALHNLAVYLTRNGSEAEDLVQETYVRAMRFSHRFQPGTHLRAWLFQILRNTFLTFYRLREREPALSEDGVPEGEAPMFHDAPAGMARAPGPTWIWSGPWRSCPRSSGRRSCWPRSRGWRWRTWRASWTARWAP